MKKAITQHRRRLGNREYYDTLVALFKLSSTIVKINYEGFEIKNNMIFSSIIKKIQKWSARWISFNTRTMRRERAPKQDNDTHKDQGDSEIENAKGEGRGELSEELSGGVQVGMQLRSAKTSQPDLTHSWAATLPNLLTSNSSLSTA